MVASHDTKLLLTFFVTCYLKLQQSCSLKVHVGIQACSSIKTI